MRSEAKPHSRTGANLHAGVRGFAVSFNAVRTPAFQAAIPIEIEPSRVLRSNRNLLWKLERFHMMLLIGFTVILAAVAMPAVPAASGTITLGPPEDVYFGPLVNARNGHISFQKDDQGYKIWLPGRLKSANQAAPTPTSFQIFVLICQVKDLDLIPGLANDL